MYVAVAFRLQLQTWFRMPDLGLRHGLADGYLSARKNVGPGLYNTEAVLTQQQVCRQADRAPVCERCPFYHLNGGHLLRH